jgi:hypothetical protein
MGAYKKDNKRGRQTGGSGRREDSKGVSAGQEYKMKREGRGVERERERDGEWIER